MEKTTYIFQIDVTARPLTKEFKALKSTIRGLGIADCPNARLVLEKRAIEDVVKAYEKKYPEVRIEATAKSIRIEHKFLIVEGLDDPDTQNDEQNEEN